MPLIDFDCIRHRVSLGKVFWLLNYRTTITYHTKGRGPCPARCDDDPRCCSFTFLENVWHCHRCDRGGGVLEFYLTATGLPIVEAVKEICRGLKMKVPYLPRAKVRRPRNRCRHRKDVDLPEEDEV